MIDWRSCSEISARSENEFLETLGRRKRELMDRELLILEVGTWHGATAALLAQFGLVYAIDLWGDLLDCEADRETIGQVSFEPFIRNMIRLDLINKRVFPIVSSSLFLDTIPFSMNFDLIYIDANHSLEGATRDALMTERHLAKDGYYVFHDTGHDGVKKVVGDLLSSGRFEILDQFGWAKCLIRK